MGELQEEPLDAIARRARVLGWKTRRDGKWLHLEHPGKRRSQSYVLRDEGGVELWGDGRSCEHDRALLERDGDAIDVLRSLTAQAEDMRAALDRMDADILRLQALVVGGNG